MNRPFVPNQLDDTGASSLSNASDVGGFRMEDFELDPDLDISGFFRQPQNEPTPPAPRQPQYNYQQPYPYSQSPQYSPVAGPSDPYATTTTQPPSFPPQPRHPAAPPQAPLNVHATQQSRHRQESLLTGSPYNAQFVHYRHGSDIRTDEDNETGRGSNSGSLGQTSRSSQAGTRGSLGSQSRGGEAGQGETRKRKRPNVPQPQQRSVAGKSTPASSRRSAPDDHVESPILPSFSESGSDTPPQTVSNTDQEALAEIIRASYIHLAVATMMFPRWVNKPREECSEARREVSIPSVIAEARVILGSIFGKPADEVPGSSD